MSLLKLVDENGQINEDQEIWYSDELLHENMKTSSIAKTIHMFALRELILNL